MNQTSGISFAQSQIFHLYFITLSCNAVTLACAIFYS